MTRWRWQRAIGLVGSVVALTISPCAMQSALRWALPNQYRRWSSIDEWLKKDIDAVEDWLEAAIESSGLANSTPFRAERLFSVRQMAKPNW